MDSNVTKSRPRRNKNNLEPELQAQLEWIRARYDHGAMSPALFEYTKLLETEIAWLQHGELRP